MSATAEAKVPAILARHRAVRGTLLSWAQAEELLGEGRHAIRKRALAAFAAAHPGLRPDQSAALLATEGARYAWASFLVTMIRPAPAAQWQIYVREVAR